MEGTRSKLTAEITVSLQKDLIACCVEHHEMLHEDFINFSHLAQVIFTL